MSKRKKIEKYLFETIAVTFAMATFGAAMGGFLMDTFGSGVTVYGGFFAYGLGGLYYERIFQLFGLSVVLGVLLLIFISDLVLEKVMLLWRYVIFLPLAIVAISAFVIMFRWFPIDVWQWWALLIAVFVTSSLGSMIPMFVKVRREDKQYEKALSDYKKKQVKM